MINSINLEQFKNLIKQDKENLEIIDVREEDEFKNIRIKNSTLIPMGKIMDNLDKINWDKKVVLVCRSGGRSGYVAKMLSGIGKKVSNLEGGINSLEEDNCECLER
ncbi:MAG: Rhodanese domain protein [Candidatus Moranbacteria bacterium GW2011_GWE1_35_17]|nr:MAG: Rhodanese domain protein [Candidatus Moranbacteria bacterium GW2011_GWE1_35_17]KKP71501.1 MAG: Rhodanese domain protein [Candidatus Moranbacteria bacterium GW2011_GWE2_35_164]KKP84567.1 MAG: Rhodanese domain protein [Candidatus Moranbacteria bacterium GW2011_GWF2_35_54]KKP84599.1 MAG: Rhodanese domain protein [Candidatus Moranbacteria bacterium GW2011_GWF1_35_5]